MAGFRRPATIAAACASGRTTWTDHLAAVAASLEVSTVAAEGEIVDTSGTRWHRDMTTDDAEWCRELWSQRFDTVSTDLVKAVIDEEQIKAIVAMIGTDRAGFATAAATTADGIEEDFYIDVDRYVRQSDPVGLIHQITVETQYEGQDVASGLTAQILPWLLHEWRIEDVLAVCWVRDGNVDYLPVARKYGFESMQFYENYYGSDRECPDCDGDCGCPAELFRYSTRSLPGDSR